VPKLTNQSEAWQHGYDWADGKGPFADEDFDVALDALGYDFLSKEADDFQKGVDFRQIEQAEDAEFGE
jgi:hypothetical protein